jgi:outer membrane translocation and assembly module TamA
MLRKVVKPDSQNLDINIPPKKGDVVVFHNTLVNDAATYPKRLIQDHLHGGMPVIKGEKWMVNLWFRENLKVLITLFLKNFG